LEVALTYSPTVWTDGVTDVDAARLNKIEQQLALLSNTAPAAVEYKGDFVPAQTYYDGDMVVYQGILYMCTKGPVSTAPDLFPPAGAQDAVPRSVIDAAGDLIVGSAPDQVQRLAPGTQGHVLTRVASAPGVAWQALPTVTTPLATTLPGSPVDGQETILTDSLTSPTWQWRFRYNAGSSSAYKWEFVGGSPLYMASVPNAAFNTLTQVGATGLYYASGSAWTTVRSGDYLLEGIARVAANGATNPYIASQAFVGSAAAGDAGGTQLLTVTGDEHQIPHFDKVGGVVQGQLLGIGWSSSAAATTKLVVQKTRVQPVRVG
jgi:hypothetical protein